MWQSAALLLSLALAPAQAAKLEVTNVRTTYGLLGPARPDAKSPKVLPGEMLLISFDIAGLKPQEKPKEDKPKREPKVEEGQLRFSHYLDVYDGGGKSIYERPLGEIHFVPVLGGARIPHAVVVPTGLDHKPGKYHLKVRIYDLVADANQKQPVVLEQPFEIVPLEFGLVHFQLSLDNAGRVRVPNVAVVGQVLYVNAVAIGFKFDQKKGNVKVEMTLLDEAGNALGTRPILVHSESIPDGTPALPVQFDLPITRAGKFQIQLSASDEAGKKKAALKVPLTTLESK